MSAYDIAVQNDLPELKNLFDMLREKYRVWDGSWFYQGIYANAEWGNISIRKF
jgi:hypothetical protein